MRRVTLDEARSRFGELLDELRLDTSFGEEDGSFFLVEDGKPVGIVIGREGLLQILDQQQEWLKTAIAEALADNAAGRYVELEDDEDWRQFAERIKRKGRERLAREGADPGGCECPDAAE